MISFRRFECAAIILVIFMPPGSVSSANDGIDRARWKEEVQLATGEVVILDREATRSTHGFPVAQRGPRLDQRIRFPDGRTTWIGVRSMSPLAIELKNGKWYVAVNIRSRELCKQYNDPPDSTVFFRTEDDNWVQITREEFPLGGKVNLLASPWGATSAYDASGLIKNENKHLAKPYNNIVNDDLAKVMSHPSTNACEIIKKN